MDDDFGGPAKEVIYENSYITSPDGYGPNKKFQRSRVQQVRGGPLVPVKLQPGAPPQMLSDTLRTKMEGKEYDPVRSAQTAKELTDIIKERVKAMGYDRYKLVVQVAVGQKKGQAMRFASRCLWDTSCDNYASEFYENKTLYCVAQVYGLYYE